MNKFKLGDLPICMRNKIELTFKRIDTHGTALTYLSPEIMAKAEFVPELISNKTDIWLVSFIFYVEFVMLTNIFNLKS